MSDLISRQAAIDALGERPVVWDEWTNEYSLGQRNQYDSDLLAIETVPTIDPVKRGRWEHRMLTSYPAKAICVCNLCWQVMDREYFYCPHCGAKMERSEDATD